MKILDDNMVNTVVEFWLGDAQDVPDVVNERVKLWYGGDPETDEIIRNEFGELFERAKNGELSYWKKNAFGCLAIVILLDQFSRNIYRGTADAFAQDALARETTMYAIDNQFDMSLSVPGRAFLYHPLLHSEKLADQRLYLSLCRQMREVVDPEWSAYVNSILKFALDHHGIVERFGRFPHRNDIFNRKSTEDELVFLKTASRYGQ